jgi:uncharacterized membrane protein
VALDSTTGLSTRTASVLAYLGWWVTGLIFWALERRDELVRFHAIQSTVAFGGLALGIGACGLVALVMLSFAPTGFTLFLGLAVALWIVGLAVWLVALWKASQGQRWRIPLAARVADRWSLAGTISRLEA